MTLISKYRGYPTVCLSDCLSVLDSSICCLAFEVSLTWDTEWLFLCWRGVRRYKPSDAVGHPELKAVRQANKQINILLSVLGVPGKRNTHTHTHTYLWYTKSEKEVHKDKNTWNVPFPVRMLCCLCTSCVKLNEKARWRASKVTNTLSQV